METLLTSTTDYRTWLSRELLRRIEVNPAYSLRRFAQQLGTSPSTLSGVLSGKRALTLKAATKIIERLGLGPSDARQFVGMVASTRAGVVPAASDYLQLSEEAFRVIADWYHYAILELTLIPGCEPNPRWFARKLSIPVAVATQAIRRLTDLGLLELKDGRLIKTSTQLSSPNVTKSAAVRRRHKQILHKAAESLDQHAVEERDISSMTMAIDPELLPEARKRITAFRRELCAFLESGKRKRVYEFSLQLFPLSTGKAFTEQER